MEVFKDAHKRYFIPNKQHPSISEIEGSVL